MPDISNVTEKYISGEQPNPNKKQAEALWEKFLELLSQAVSKQTEIKTWFSVLNPISFENNILTVSVPSSDFYSMIEKRYSRQISRILESGLLGENGKLNYQISQHSLFEDVNVQKTENNTTILDFRYPYGRENSEKSKGNLSTVKTGNDYSANIPAFSSNLNPKNTFDSFVRGESNELAVSVAYAIANNPGKIYNPLLIYGGVGLGKTHLVQAIGNEILKNDPSKKIYYTTSPEFTTQFTTTMAKTKIDLTSGNELTKKLDSFYKSLDVLILDDIQNLEGKRGTQDFMYQIFNVLYNNKKHIIFSSDKPLNQLKSIEERLISRFHWGMTADIQQPSWEMRVAIIQKKLEEVGTDMPEEVIHYVATHVKDSIRTLEGCIVGMIAESALIYKGDITMAIAEKVINRVVGNVRRTRSVSIENIIFAVADYFKITESQILSRKRTKEIAFARQVAMYLAKEMTTHTLELIGLNFGGKDHATVLYAYNLIKENLKKSKELQNIICDIKESINHL